MELTIWKWYSHFENEEKWLNSMVDKGYALKSYTWLKYTFEKCQPGEFIYRIELLNNLPSHHESRAYISFIEDTGAEYVTSYMRWVYFRRRTSQGTFDIYSDAESRIGHYKRILGLWGIIGLYNLFMFFSNIFRAAELFEQGAGFMFAIMWLNLVLGAFLVGLCVPYIFKIRKLMNGKKLRE